MKRARGIALFVSVVALAATICWARVRFNSIYLGGALENVAGIDPRGGTTPFQYRVLVPKLVRFLHEQVFTRASPLAIFRVIDTACLVAAFYVLRRLARETLGNARAALAVGFGLLALVTVHFVLSREYPFWYAWDMASLAVFTYGLWLLRRREWLVFYPLFVLGTFNRETTCFLTFAYVFTAWRTEPRARLALHVVVQATLWLGVKRLLWVLYHHAKGNDVFQPAWRENWESLADPAMYPWFALAFGGLWLPLALLYRRIREPWIRALVLVIAPFALGMFFAGVWTELRIWGELIPVVLLGVAAGWLGRNTAIARSALSVETRP